MCVCVCWLSCSSLESPLKWQVRMLKVIKVHVVNDLLRTHYPFSLTLLSPFHCVALSATFLLYYHGVIIIFVPLLSSRGWGLTASSPTAAKELQSWTRGLSRRRSQEGGVGGGWGQRSHSGPDLAVHSHLATLVLWLSGDNTQAFYFKFKPWKTLIQCCLKWYSTLIK